MKSKTEHEWSCIVSISEEGFIEQGADMSSLLHYIDDPTLELWDTVLMESSTNKVFDVLSYAAQRTFEKICSIITPDITPSVINFNIFPVPPDSWESSEICEFVVVLAYTEQSVGDKPEWVN